MYVFYFSVTEFQTCMDMQSPRISSFLIPVLRLLLLYVRIFISALYLTGFYFGSSFFCFGHSFVAFFAAHFCSLFVFSGH